MKRLGYLKQLFKLFNDIPLGGILFEEPGVISMNEIWGYPLISPTHHFSYLASLLCLLVPSFGKRGEEKMECKRAFFGDQQRLARLARRKKRPEDLVDAIYNASY